MHLVTTYHPRCWEDMLSRCSLDAERLGRVRSGAHRFSAASFYYGDVNSSNLKRHENDKRLAVLRCTGHVPTQAFYMQGPLAQLVRVPCS